MSTDAGLVVVRGHEKLAELSKALKASGDKQLRRDLMRGLREGVKPVIPQIRLHAASILPDSGGLAELVAGRKYAARSNLSPRAAAVRVVSTSPGRMRALNKGMLRHPVYGNRQKWVSQSVEPGFFSEPIEDSAPAIRRSLERVMADIAKRIESSV